MLGAKSGISAQGCFDGLRGNTFRVLGRVGRLEWSADEARSIRLGISTYGHLGFLDLALNILNLLLFLLFGGQFTVLISRLC